jgi:hypothetical protein
MQNGEKKECGRNKEKLKYKEMLHPYNIFWNHKDLRWNKKKMW